MEPFKNALALWRLEWRVRTAVDKERALQEAVQEATALGIENAEEWLRQRLGLTVSGTTTLPTLPSKPGKGQAEAKPFKFPTLRPPGLSGGK